jgi:MerR family transcriptional regulator, copper efflux regulator
MRIIDVARTTGCSTSALRYYEDQGLLQPDKRSEAGYRLYSNEVVGRVSFIQRAKALGLTLREIRQLLQEPLDHSTDQIKLRHAIAHKLADTRDRIAELEHLKGELEALQARLDYGQIVAKCGNIGDCECWLPTEKEVRQMVNNSGGCSCCGCTCPGSGICSCCGCPCPWFRFNN